VATERQIFRKTSLQRFASPEELDQAIAITGDGSWLALLAVLLVCATVVVWAFFGALTTTVVASGHIMPTPDGFDVRVTVPASEAGDIRPGMAAEIVPATIRREESGFIRGSVADILHPTDDASPEHAGAQVELRIVLDRDAHAARAGSRVVWSSSHRPSIDLASGTPAVVEIVTHRRAPITWVVPNLRERSGF
jgi:hypothetical protein